MGYETQGRGFASDDSIAAKSARVWRVGMISGVPALVVVALALTATPAAAQLRVCNQSSETISRAVAYRDRQPEGRFISRGWYVAKPGECPTVVGGPLRERYYYLRGNGTQGSTWGGTVRMCTANDKFSYTGEADCERSGFKSEDFFVIDSGASTAMTFTLSSAPVQPGDNGRDAVADLRVSWRYSLLDDGSMVMQLHNARPTTVSFQMQCFTRSNMSKVLSLSVPAKGMSEVGFVEGWPGNFVAGERCEAFHGNERLWTARVP